MKLFTFILILLQIGSSLPFRCFANDEELAVRLKQDLQHEANRKNSFKDFDVEKNKNEKEQNKGLALWLEEQEQWDLTREKAIFEYKKNKRPTPEEGSKEYYDDLAVKERAERVVEDARRQHVQVKKNILAQFQAQDEISEEEEFSLYNQRPRYDLRKRGRNKWTKSGAAIGGASGGSAPPPPSGGGFQGGGDTFDFPPAPPPDMPSDFEDFPPPPNDFGQPGFESGFGDAPIPPPPPPPPPEGGWDF